MEIIEINIQNFGKLTDFNLKFNAELNQIVQENGFGKTTIMNFIRAMFYGFNKKSERQKFTPWNKATFGGYIIFSHNNVIYRLERTFGIRNSLDEVKLFNTHTMQEINIQNIGEHFFGLDESTFLRLLYVDENMLSAQTTSVLIGKLTKLTQTQQTVISSFDSAMEILDSKRSFLQKQNGKGAIPEKTTQLLSLKRELENANKSLELSEKYAQEIKELKEKEISLKQKLSDLETQIELATTQEANQQNLKQLNFLLNEKQTLENEQSKILALFPLGFPSQDSINSYSSKLNELTSLQTLLNDQQSQSQLNQTNTICNLNETQETFKIKKEQAISLITNSAQHKKHNKLPTKLIFPFSFSAISLIFVIIGLTINQPILTIFSSIILTFSIILCIVFYLKQPRTLNEQKILHQINNLFPNQNFTSLNQAMQQLNELEMALSLTYQSNAKIKDLKQNISRLENELNAFNENFNIKSTSFQNALDQLKSLISNFENLSQDITKINLQISNFESLNQSLNSPKLNLNSLKLQRNQIIHLLDETKNLILEKENKKISEDNLAERLDQIKTTLSSTQCELDELTKELNIVKLTKEFLEQSKITLSSKYITPTQNNLNELASKFPNTKNYLPLHLKDDLSMLYEQNNLLRDSSTLSTGLKHTFAILTRIALINTIFENQPMPILLDDTFQTLDENNLVSMKNLINELAKSNQIIYFTCSKERKF